MRVLLISANTETMNMVPLPLGLNIVAVAARNAGHQVEMIDLMGNGDHTEIIRTAIERMQPAVIGLSVRNIDNQSMAETKFLLDPVRDDVRLCREFSGAPVVLGGAGFSIFPEAVLRYLGADMGVCGEGEVAFVRLLEALEKGEDVAGIDGICLPGQPVSSCAQRDHLDCLPLPDPALWHIPPGTPDIWIPFQTRRGCPMKCSYCSTPMLEGTAVRKHDIAAVVENLRRHAAAGFDHFYFVDNTFNFPPAYPKDLCGAIGDAGLKIAWRSILYPGSIDTDLAQRMAQAGCVEVSLGFESGCDRILRNLNKKYTVEKVREAAHLLREHGIRRMGFLLLGGPGEDRDSVMESLAFAETLNLDMLKVSSGIRIYPDTELARVAREEGVISADDDLLQPRFYLARGLEDWLPQLIAEWVAERPYCTT